MTRGEEEEEEEEKRERERERERERGQRKIHRGVVPWKTVTVTAARTTRRKRRKKRKEREWERQRAKTGTETRRKADELARQRLCAWRQRFPKCSGVRCSNIYFDSWNFIPGAWKIHLREEIWNSSIVTARDVSVRLAKLVSALGSNFFFFFGTSFARHTILLNNLARICKFRTTSYLQKNFRNYVCTRRVKHFGI